MQQMTYGQIKKMVQGEDGCCTDDSRLEALMLNCLLEMWTELCDCPEFQVSGQWCPVPCEPSVAFSSILDGVEVGQVDQILDSSGNCLEPLPDEKLKMARTSQSQGKPTHFYFWGDQMFLHPIPDQYYDYTIYAYRKPACELYDDVDGMRVWRNDDLPAEFHSIYYKCVLAMAALEVENFEVATTWLQIASAEFDSLRMKKEQGPTKASSGVLYMSYAKNNDACCFEPPVPQASYKETVYAQPEYSWEEKKGKPKQVIPDKLMPFPMVIPKVRKSAVGEWDPTCL